MSGVSCRDQEEGAAADGGGIRRRRSRAEQEEHGRVSAQRTVQEQQGETEETNSGASLQDR